MTRYRTCQFCGAVRMLYQVVDGEKVRICYVCHKVQKRVTLSPEMARCLDFVRRHEGQIYRHNGGYWAAKEWRSGTGESFRATTVEALVLRGMLEYSDWYDKVNKLVNASAQLSSSANPDIRKG